MSLRAMRNLPGRNKAVRNKKGLSFLDFYPKTNMKAEELFLSPSHDCCAFLVLEFDSVGYTKADILAHIRLTLSESKKFRRPVICYATSKEKEYLEELQKCPWVIYSLKTKSRQGKYMVHMFILDGTKVVED